MSGAAPSLVPMMGIACVPVDSWHVLFGMISVCDCAFGFVHGQVIDVIDWITLSDSVRLFCVMIESYF